MKKTDQELKEEFQKLSTSYSSLKKEYDKLCKSFISPTDSQPEPKKPTGSDQNDYVTHEEIFRHMGNMMDSVHNRIDSVASMIYAQQDRHYDYVNDHNKNHVPKLTTASQMQKFLKVIGAENDYEVEKPSIRVSNSRRGAIVEAEYHAIKKS